jgi:hypothetical protein
MAVYQVPQVKPTCKFEDGEPDDKGCYEKTYTSEKEGT